MFEHFGLKDVFYGLWKYKWKMLLGAVCLCLAATAVFMLFPIQTEAPEIETGGQTELQRKEIYFYFDYSGTDPALSAEVLSQMYLSTVEKQTCKEFVVDYILDRITKADIVTYLNGTVREDQITTNFFSQYINVSTDSTDVGVTILSRTPNREFTNILCEAYTEWFRYLVSDNPHVSLMLVSENEDVMTISNRTTSTISEERNWSVSKIIVITFVLAVLVECIIVFFIILFRPTLNRRTDYEQVGLNVFGTVKIPRKEQL